MEDTQQVTTPVTDENEKLIQEMLRVVDKVELPSELTREPVLHKGDETLPAPMVVQHVSSAGYVNIWETRTHEPAICLYYMLPSRLRQRREDGSYRWTVIDPKILPKRGTYKCLLHADSPDRAHYSELGFRTCRKSNLNNPYQVRQHMLKKHKAEWAAIEEERKERERQEDRQIQQLLLKQMVKPEPTEPEIMSITPAWLEEEAKQVEPIVEENAEEPRKLLDYEYRCKYCKTIHRKTSRIGQKHLKYKE